MIVRNDASLARALDPSWWLAVGLYVYFPLAQHVDPFLTWSTTDPLAPALLQAFAAVVALVLAVVVPAFQHHAQRVHERQREVQADIASKVRMLENMQSLATAVTSLHTLASETVPESQEQAKGLSESLRFNASDLLQLLASVPLHELPDKDSVNELLTLRSLLIGFGRILGDAPVVSGTAWPTPEVLEDGLHRSVECGDRVERRIRAFRTQ